PQTVDAVECTDTLTCVVEDGIVWYEIGSAEDFAAFGKLCRSYIETTATTSALAVGLNARFTSDIDLGSKHFGSYRLAVNSSVNGETSKTLLLYTGTIDAMGHTIYNYTYKAGSEHYNPGYIGSLNGGCVKNLNMVNVDCYFASPGTSATTLGAVLVSNGSSGTIKNCYIQGKAQIDTRAQTSKRWFAVYGTFVARSYNVNIINCHSAVDMDNFTGYPSGGNTTKYKSAHVTTSASAGGTTNNHGIGGIVGTAYHVNITDGTVLTNCTNSGKIFAPNYRRVGGIFGSMNSKKHLYKNCSNSGDIVAYGDVGGIVGFAGSEVYVTNSAYNTGDITAVAVQNTYDEEVSRTTDNAFAAGIAIGGRARSDASLPVYNTGDIRVMNDGVGEYKETVTITDVGPDGIEGTEDDVTKTEVTYSGKDIYSAEALPIYNNYTAQLFVTDVESKAHSSKSPGFYSTDKSAIAYSKPITTTDNNQTPDDTSDDTSIVVQTETALGTGVSPDALTAELLGGNFAEDFGINGGLPILASEKDSIHTDEETIEIGSYVNASGANVVKTAQVKLTEASFVALDVIPVTDSVTIAVFDGETKVSETTVVKAQKVSLPAPENAVIVATQGRALIKVVEETSAQKLYATAIKAGFPNDVSATVAVALYGADGSLKKVSYNANSPVINIGTKDIPSNQVYAFIDLNGVDVKGCTLKAFVWDNMSSTPLQETATLE
ncbi:MAG: hypothetical protein IKU60_05440, partial [Clostridia bacterium]|nr:hypothetical protein [Clostridia bacterium]